KIKRRGKLGRHTTVEASTESSADLGRTFSNLGTSRSGSGRSPSEITGATTIVINSLIPLHLHVDPPNQNRASIISFKGTCNL
ncbi:hypothetical protein A2U01_0008271, partial [Trifolium medium]|nr:hypothetical protein [Trifolium medium]